MALYRVEWSLQGVTTVEAVGEKEARKMVEWDLPDEALYEDITDMDISGVSLEEEGDA